MKKNAQIILSGLTSEDVSHTTHFRPALYPRATPGPFGGLGLREGQEIELTRQGPGEPRQTPAARPARRAKATKLVEMSAAVAAGSVLIVVAALLAASVLSPPIARALRLPTSKLVRVTNGRKAGNGDPDGDGAHPAPPPPLPGWFAFSILNPAHPVARAWSRSPRPSRAVLTWRLVGIALAVASLAVNASTGGGFGADGWWAAFFTNWTFVLMLAATLLAAWVSWRAVAADRRRGKPAESSLKPAAPLPWRLDQRAHVLLMAALAPAALFVTIFYWSALFPADSKARGGAPPHPDAVMKHGVNAVWALVDTILARTPGASPHFPVLAAYAGTYLIFLFSFHAGAGVWVYRVFDWGRGPATLGVYAALPCLLAVCALALYGLAAGREAGRRRLERKWGGGGGGGGAAPPPPAAAAAAAAAVGNDSGGAGAV